MFGIDLVALALTLLIGGVAGTLAWAAALPLGFLLGSMVVTAIWAVTGRKVLGRAVTLPARLRFSFVPVIGVAIGGAFTPAVVGQMPGWWPTLLALCVFVPMAHAMGYAIYRRMGIGRQEALYGAVPGGLLESVTLAETAGADVRVVTVLQFLRLILTILTVPLIFWGITGHTVGSASGASLSSAPLGWADAGLLVVAALSGVAVARALRFPGWIMTGPLVASAVLHGLGWVKGIPPDWLVAGTQVVLGTGLGARFAGIERAVLAQAGQAALVNGAAALLLAFGFAAGLHWAVGEPVAAVFLAFAPGGLAEMSLVALSLQIGVVFVTAHHVARIVLAVLIAQVAGRWV